jgi:hypothetical protein
VSLYTGGSYFFLYPKWSKLVTITLLYTNTPYSSKDSSVFIFQLINQGLMRIISAPNQPSMATDPESQTNADLREYKSLTPTLQETEERTPTLLCLFYLMSDLMGPDLSVVRTLMSRRPTRSSRRTFNEKHSERKNTI